MTDVLALGELLIDFTPAGSSPAGQALYEQNPGGAPANVLAAVVRLGGSAAFAGTVGDDSFGHFLKNVLDTANIDSHGLHFTKATGTTLAFVHLDGQGDRSFSFYRSPGADTLLTVADLDQARIANAKIFHFGSLSMTAEPARSATLAAVAYARKAGRLISYDPNYRPLLWRSPAEAMLRMKVGFGLSDIVKIADNELELLTGSADPAAASAMILAMGPRLVLVTLGADGCFFRNRKTCGTVPGFKVDAVDTTGAGDSFTGAMLFQIAALNDHLEDLDAAALTRMVRFANATGALCVTKRGAIPAMPSRADVEAVLANPSALTPPDAHGSVTPKGSYGHHT